MSAPDKKRDKFRIGASVQTTPPIVEPPQRPEAFLVENKRLDGRTPDEFRPIFLKTGVINQASGSAYLELERTKVICGVYGPRQTPKTGYTEEGKLNCDVKFATFACDELGGGLGKRRKYAPDKQEKEYSDLMKQALVSSLRLDTFPKSEVDVNALVLEDGGGGFGAAITCASLALADAGVEMYDLVAACGVGLVDGKIFLDPTKTEEQYLEASMLLAMMPSMAEITQLVESGVLEPTTLQEMLDLAMDGCGKVHALMRQHLVETTLSKLKLQKQKEHTGADVQPHDSQ